MSSPYRDQGQTQSFELLVDPLASQKFATDHRTRMRLLLSTAMCILFARSSILHVLTLGPQPSGMTMALDMVLIALAIGSIIVQWPRRARFPS